MDRIKCEVELALDEFALEEVERVAERLCVPRSRLVQRAVRYWLDEESASRLAARPMGGAPPSPYPAVPLAVDLTTQEWEAVQRAARRHDIEPDRLIGHAVLLMLADIAAGKLFATVARSTNGMEPEL